MAEMKPDDDGRRPRRIRDLGRHLPINKGPSGELAESVRKLPQITGRGTKAALSFLESVAKGVLGNIKPTPIPGRDERFRRNLLKVVADSPLTAELGKVLKVDVRASVHESFGKPVLVSVDLLLPDPRYRLTEVRDLYHRRLLEEAERTGEPEEKERVHQIRQSMELDHSGGPKDYDPHRDLDPQLHLDHKQQQALAILLGDLLLRLVEVCWDNPEIAPVAVRGRVVAVHGDPQEVLEHKHSRRHVQISDHETLVLDMRDLGFVDEIARVNDLYEIYGAPKSDPQWRP